MQKEKTMYFPLFIDLTDRKIMIVGMGKIAMRRIRTLSSFSPQVLVIAKEIDPVYRKEAEELFSGGRIAFREKLFEETDLEWQPEIVIAATDNSALNIRIGTSAKELGALVNVASDASRCDFYFPAVALSDEIVAGVTGRGNNHKKVAQVTDKIRRLLHLESTIL